MKKYAAFFLSIAILATMAFGISSCKEDEPPTPPKLSFAESSITVPEDEGVIEVEVVLDKAYSKDLTIEYDLAGTASDQHDVGTALADYQVNGDRGVVVIESGETTGIIEIQILNDGTYEESETIQLSIVDINTSDIELTSEDEIEITITSDDAQSTASFTTTTMTVNEADGPEVLQLTVQLDNPASVDVTIEYTLAESTAKDSLSAWNVDPQKRQPYDFYIHNEGAAGKVVIPAGQSSGNIEIQVLSDLFYEADEIIKVKLTGSGSAIIGTSNTATITIKQEDGRILGLVWEPTYTDVDMDMFLWVGPDVNTLNELLALAIRASTTIKEEVIFLPKAFSDGVEDAAFGLSYVYYQGTPNPMNFEVHFIDVVSGAFEPEAERDLYAASYTPANINKWDLETGTEPAIVQTFRIVNGAYIEITDITVPASGSRMKKQTLPERLQRTTGNPSGVYLNWK